MKRNTILWGLVGVVVASMLGLTTDQIIQNVYDSTNTAFKVNVVAGSAPITPPSSGGAVGSSLNSGCNVTWSGTGYVYNVSVCSYSINGTSYTAPATNITLAAPDATLDRIDSIVVNTSSIWTVEQGTNSATPSQPSVDPTTEIAVVFVFVTHNTTTPTGSANENIYLNNAEWTTTAGSGTNCDDTTNPQQGAKDCKMTAIAANAFTKWVRSSSVNPGSYQQLVMWFAPISWGNSRAFTLQFRLAGVSKGVTVTIQNGSFGLSTSSTSYQLLAIPMSMFGLSGTNIDELRINPSGNGGTFSTYVDTIYLQSNVNVTAPTGITQAQGDVRYMLQSAPSYYGPLYTPPPVPMSGNLTADTTNTAIKDRTVDCTSGSSTDKTYTLPAATGSQRIIDLWKVDSGTKACIASKAGSDTINGNSTRTLASRYNHDTYRDQASTVWLAVGDGT